MKWRLLKTSDSLKWREVLGHFAQADIYFLPEYHTVYEANGDGVACAFVAELGNDVLFYPFLLRRIDRVVHEPLRQQWCDIETV